MLFGRAKSVLSEFLSNAEAQVRHPRRPFVPGNFASVPEVPEGWLGGLGAAARVAARKADQNWRSWSI